MGLILLKQIVAMICMVAVGVILGKCRVVDGEQSRSISQVMIYACSPCALFSAFQTTFTMDKAEGLLMVSLGAFGTFVLYVIAARLLMKPKNGLSPAEACCAVFSNCANIVIPIIQGIWGMEYVIYISPYILMSNILMWSYGVRLMGGEKKPLWKMMMHPNIVAVLLGFVLFVTNVRLPGPIQQGISAVGSCVGPMSMVVIGILLAETPLGKMLHDKRIFRTVALRLVVYPLLAVAVAAVVGFFWQGAEHETVLLVLLLCSLGPSASNLTGMAQTLRHPETSLVSAVNALSVILCAGTMPLQCMLLQMLLTR